VRVLITRCTAASRQDRIFLDAPPPIPTEPLGPPRGEVSGRVTSAGPLFGGRGLIKSTDAEGTAVKSHPDYKVVYGRLKNRPVPIDLWEELQMLREAVLDLHKRLQKKESILLGG
jgi:hypothetical protein